MRMRMVQGWAARLAALAVLLTSVRAASPRQRRHTPDMDSDDFLFYPELIKRLQNDIAGQLTNPSSYTDDVTSDIVRVPKEFHSQPLWSNLAGFSRSRRQPEKTNSVLPPWSEFCRMLRMNGCGKFKRSILVSP